MATDTATGEDQKYSDNCVSRRRRAAVGEWAATRMGGRCARQSSQLHLCLPSSPRCSIRRIALASVLACFASSQSLALAQPLEARSDTVIVRSGIHAERVRGGLIWSASEGRFTLEELARKCAPVLWFSHGEPLFIMGIRGPQPIVGDTTPTPYVVYYGIKLIVVVSDSGESDALSSDSHVQNLQWSYSHEAGAFDANTIVSIVIRFYFYYPWDIGFGGHQHDLEGFEVYIESVKNQQALKVARIAASAHGISWYTNELG